MEMECLKKVIIHINKMINRENLYFRFSPILMTYIAKAMDSNVIISYEKIKILCT